MTDIRHYGIPGMKWGRRKDGRRVTVGPGLRGKLREAGGIYKDALKDDISKVQNFGKKLAERTKPSPDAAKAKTLAKKPINKLSNDELRTVITRLQLEKQYKDLNKQGVGKGKRALRDMLANLAAQGVNSYARTQVDPRFVDMFTQAKERVRGNRS